MDNQHRKIKGYRELTQEEIDLMNRVKEMGIQLKAVMDDVQAHLTSQADNATADEQARLKAAEPQRWAAIGKTDLQTGLMALTRSIAQPETL